MFKRVLIMILALSGSVFASENCVEQYKGVCRDSCHKGEIAAEGAFIDCDEKQDCCVADPAPKKPETDSNSPVFNPADGSGPRPAQGK